MDEQGSNTSPSTPSRLERAVRHAQLIERSGTIDASFDSLTDAIVVTGAELELPGPIIAYVNAAFVEMSGYDREELIGTDPRIMQGYDTDHAELARMKVSLLAGEPFEGSVLNYRKTGEEYIVGWAIVPIRDGDGAIRQWLSLQSDIMHDGRTARAEVA